MKDRSANLTILDFEITHRCNKYCRLCDHRCSTSSYEMSLEQYDYVVELVGRRDEIRTVLIIGGEPLTHPDFERFIYCIQRDFTNASITVQTNGRLLPKHYEPDIRWVLTHYPGFNDDIVDEYGGETNVDVAWSNGLFWDPFVDPNLSEEDAKRARGMCTFSVRILGRRLYSCCLSEPVERDFNLEGVSVPFTDNWRNDIYGIHTWRACQHCFRAGHLINQGAMYPRRTERHNDQEGTQQTGGDTKGTPEPA